MIKRFTLLIILLQSCAVVDYKDVPALTRSILLGAPDQDVTPSFYESMPYSFAKVKIGRSRIGFMVLLSIDDEIYEWIGSYEERIFTKHGKIISTSGLDYNINFINSQDLNVNCDYCSATYQIQVDSPDALLIQEVKNNFNKNDEITLIKKVRASSYIEKFETKKLRWQGENYYWFNNNGQPIKSIQKVHPFLGEVEITFFYK